jgi:hypothetical protein
MLGLFAFEEHFNNPVFISLAALLVATATATVAGSRRALLDAAPIETASLRTPPSPVPSP